MRTLDTSCDRVVELRQYTLYPGRRDELIALFEREFVAPQDAVGARIRGCFRDADDADRFVWLRAFDSMDAQRAALTTFYGGPVWRDHRDAAVVTMRDSDNALLLRPLASGAAASALPLEDGACLVLIHDLRSADVEAFGALHAAVALPLLEACGAFGSTVFVTESAPKTYERLPIRTGESLLVSISRFADLDALDDGLARLRRSTALRDRAVDDLLPAFMRRPEALRLLPVKRSVAE